MTQPHGRLSPVLRWLARLPGLRRIRAMPLVDRAVVAHYRGRAATRPLLYTLRELSGRRSVGRYRPRGASIDVLLRHNTSDGNILQEFAMHHLYDEPAPVRARLAALDEPRVVDLGGHIGLFGVHILSRYPRASVVSVEADPANARLLRATAAASGHAWQVIEAAAATEGGTARYRTGAYAESRIDPAGDARVPTVDAFELMGECDLAKIDVEGGEWPILADSRLAALTCTLVVEWHPFGSPGDPEHTAAELLESAGFTTARVTGAPPGVGMLWAWRGAPTAGH